jgi:hypothetical protein
MERVLKFVALKALLICNILSLASLIDSDDKLNLPVNVTRRVGGDMYTYATSTIFFTCHDDNNLTFLVSEKRCVKNEELLNGKHAYLLIID